MFGSILQGSLFFLLGRRGVGHVVNFQDLCIKAVSVLEHTTRLTCVPFRVGGMSQCQLSDLCIEAVSVLEHTPKFAFLSASKLCNNWLHH